jgi:hypothetical protein
MRTYPHSRTATLFALIVLALTAAHAQTAQPAVKKPIGVEDYTRWRK